MPRTITITLPDNVSDAQLTQVQQAISAFEAEYRAAMADDAPPGAVLDMVEKAAKRAPVLQGQRDQIMAQRASLEGYFTKYAEAVTNEERGRALERTIAPVEELIADARQTAHGLIDGAPSAGLRAARASFVQQGITQDFFLTVERDIREAVKKALAGQ